MPELPDVAVFERYFDATSLHQEIEDVDVRDAQVLAGIDPQTLASRLKGQTFAGTRRHGKYLFVRIDGDGLLVLHFGMTGRLAYYLDPQDEPEYTQVLWIFTNGYYLAYVMPRKLGEIQMVEDADAFIHGKKLGPDVLGDDFDFRAFTQALDGRRGMVKSTLMNQKIMAGVGNVYSDEILFQARIHPRTSVDELDEDSLRHLFQTMQSVLHMAIDRDADPAQFPNNYMTPHRRPGANCPYCQGEIERTKVSGRSAYYCPSCQPPPG